MGIQSQGADIRFIQDDWESTTLGAWGLGWEVRWTAWRSRSSPTSRRSAALNSVLLPAKSHMTERIAMYLQQVNNVFDLAWTDHH